MSHFRFSIVLHNHQPVGNFGWVFEQSQQRAYRPFLERLRQFPSVRLSLHQSGILWRYQEEHDPGYFRLIREGLADGQLELLSGGFYEPILISIPERDAIAQILKLNSYLHHHFGVNPTGAWLTERIWEPHLPAILADAGIQFAPVDDTHFLYAGFTSEQLHQSYRTDQNGKGITLLPSQKRLRYLIPFGKVEDVIDYLKRTAEKHPNGCAVYADDGEKFGVWPKTFEHCYTNGWIDRFLEELSRQSDWLQIVPLGELAATPSGARAYLPSASYAEMLHWALPAEQNREFEDFEHWLDEQGKREQYGHFVRGGHWRGFLTKYEEVNLLHKKMLALSDRIDSIKENTKNREQLTIAREHLYAAQCNCPYWHGVFGGIYLPHIRKQVYAEMLSAESIFRKLERRKGVVVHETDLQGDGLVDFILESESTRAAISPSWGGMLVEYSLFDPACHLTDTISRYDEGYHRQLARAVSPEQEGSGSASIHDRVLTKEPGLEKLLTHDPYLRRAFIEHLLPVESSAAAFEFNHQPSLWRSTDHRMGSERIESGLRCISNAKISMNENSAHFAFRKEMQMLPTGELVVRYSLAIDRPVTVRFVIEQNLTLQAGHSDDRFVLINGSVADPKWLDGRSENLGVRSAALIDEWQGAAVEGTVNLSAELWRFPLFSVSQSEGGFEKVYQGTTLLFGWILDLSSTETEIQFTLKTGKLTDRFPSRRM